ncbi:Serine/threonine-protein phosphatase 2A regulatory subunit gamma isoform [Fusarium oxysporum f. sp. albedinis]|nr:Serine/threonine-protein phosphatase 2A regulatory subunit gamma isoform [Fusarium oxysporum f. sp. albedinis]
MHATISGLLEAITTSVGTDGIGAAVLPERYGALPSEVTFVPRMIGLLSGRCFGPNTEKKEDSTVRKRYFWILTPLENGYRAQKTFVFGRIDCLFARAPCLLLRIEQSISLGGFVF